ncbi:hypothetical protein GYMLUDRAFT_253340 [Collybiopsis luxurians FD-317 M1]|uniref:Uncharacterized protein n=1 Tax=Collybiopsis luxurians FD-317 M1 TaxID=944289 RepID=A0A0D0BX07_9AGAR|nr:hypothetical protein GYMLUDRAFT_253340 [Collybiopsis luxurians FD-317 M1]
MPKNATNPLQKGSSKKETKHSRYYAKHRLERQAESREYYHKRTAASKRAKRSENGPSSRSRLAVKPLVSMYQEFLTLRNDIDDWINRTAAQFPLMKPELRSQLSTHLFSGGSLSDELHRFLDRYTRKLKAFDDLDVWRLFKSVCTMQQALGGGRARLVLQFAPNMEIPQPSWGGVSLWTPQSLQLSTNIVYQRLLKLRHETERLTEISEKMKRYKGDWVWKYGEVENCLHLGRNLFLEWYNMLDDLDEDPDISELPMFFKETSRRLYELGQTLEYFTFILQKHPKVETGRN